MKGKILRKPDVAQHGHDLRTGELKRREDAANDIVRLSSTSFSAMSTHWE